MNPKSVWCVAITALLLLGAREGRAYRTAEDSPEFEGAGKVLWEEPSIAFSLYTNLPADMSWELAANSLEPGMTAWATIECGQPWMAITGSTSEPGARDDGVNTIEWVTKGWRDHGFPAEAAAMTDVQYMETEGGGWRIFEIDLYLNGESYAFASDPEASGTQKDIRAVVTHEAGHILGLLHPCELNGADGAPDCASSDAFENSVMHPEYALGRSALGADDIAGICYLYSADACPEEGCPEGSVCTSSGCLPLCGDLVCMSGHLCVDGACVEDDRREQATCGQEDPSSEDYCESGEGAIADPCEKDEDCGAGLRCSKDGQCRVACYGGILCPGDKACPVDGVCPLEGAAFGEPCDGASDCNSGICLDRDYRDPTCSRTCSGSGAHCPSGWECRDPDGEGSICAPVINDSGCSMSRPSRSSFLLSALLAVGMCGLTWFRRRRSERAPSKTLVG